MDNKDKRLDNKKIDQKDDYNYSINLYITDTNV